MSLVSALPVSDFQQLRVEARSYLRLASRLQALSRVMDLVTLVVAVVMLALCVGGAPLLGLIPFALCVAVAAVANAIRHRTLHRAHSTTWRAHVINPGPVECDCWTPE